MPLDHLAKLNIEQRRADEPGVGGEAGLLSAPLLVIAGAGSSKTNTLAHRVANLIVNGADPRRILLINVLPAGGDGDEPAGRKHLRQGAGSQGRHHDGRAHLGGDVPCDRRQAAACGNMPSRSTMRSSPSDAAARKTKADWRCDRAFTLGSLVGELT